MYKHIFLILPLSFSLHADISSFQFEGITQQKNSYSCGTGALTTLLNGLYQKNISESFLKELIRKDKDKKTQKTIEEYGYTLQHLEEGSKKIGYQSVWKKVTTENLKKLTQPTLLLIGLNSKFPHFVVFKGIVEDEAYLADPIRGNIRINYQKLISRGINEKYSSWYVMGTESPSNSDWKYKSRLFLSSNKNLRIKRHVTETQADIQSMISLNHENQLSLSVSYGRGISNMDYGNSSAKNVSDGYSFGLAYGLGDSLELSSSLNIGKATSKYFQTQKATKEYQTDWLKSYSLGVSSGFQFENNYQMGMTYDISTTYSNQEKIFSNSVNFSLYMDLLGHSVVSGIGIGNNLSLDKEINDNLKGYSGDFYMGFIEPIGDDYSSSIFASSQFGLGALSDIEPIYSIESSLSWIYSQNIQISPNLSFTFDKDRTYSSFNFGLSVIYLGDW